MDTPVDDQLRALAEALVAVSTLVGLLTCVQPLVGNKVGAVAEALPALRALIGFLACVEVGMAEQA